MPELTELCRCPVSGEPLHWTANGDLTSASGVVYPYQDGVASFLTNQGGDQAVVREFYDTFGWVPDESGLLGDTKAFVDTRDTPMNFTRNCMKRLGRYFSGGEVLLDAGSGPIPFDEIMAYGDHYATRICVDLSARALRAARQKLGDRGIYLQGDIAKLPLRDGVVDAVTCSNMIFQLPSEQQADAFREMWRVLKPGGVAVIGYWWETAKLAWRIERIAQLLPMRGPGARRDLSLPDLVHHPLSREWFESQQWPFRYSYDIYRVVTNEFMRNYVSDDWRGRLFLGALSALQSIAPRYCGMHGRMPTIVFCKDLGHPEQ